MSHRLLLAPALLLLAPCLHASADTPDLRLLPPVDETADVAAEPGDKEPDTSEDVNEDVNDQSEVAASTPWYGWVVPTYLRLPKEWETSFELGVNGSEGNSQTVNFLTSAKLKRKVAWSDLKVDFTYAQASAEGVENKNYAQFGARHDWLFEESPWSLFGQTRLTYDRFQAFDLRLVLNGGLGYQFIENDATDLKGRFGAGVSHEFNSPDERWIPEAVFGMDFEHKLSARQKLRGTVEYFPQWDAFNDFRLRVDTGWEILLDEATNMSLKLGVIDRYDSTPNGSKPNDLIYSLMLLWSL